MANVYSEHESRGTMRPLAIQTQRVSVELASRPVLRNVSIEIESGKWTNIVGPNGAGKSTLLKAIAGLIPFKGEVLYPTLKAIDPSLKDKARHISWLGQNQMGADDLSVYDVAMLGRIPHQSWLGSAGGEDHAAVESALKLTQAWDWKDRSLKDLSGGERQRALLARALAVKADILLMDEPLANLDPPHQVDWLEIVKSLIDQRKTVVSVLHEISIALRSDELIVMNCGQIEFQGSCTAPQTHKAVELVFENKIQIARVNEQWISLPRMISEI